MKADDTTEDAMLIEQTDTHFPQFSIFSWAAGILGALRAAAVKRGIGWLTDKQLVERSDDRTTLTQCRCFVEIVTTENPEGACQCEQSSCFIDITNWLLQFVDMIDFQRCYKWEPFSGKLPPSWTPWKCTNIYRQCAVSRMLSCGPSGRVSSAHSGKWPQSRLTSLWACIWSLRRCTTAPSEGPVADSFVHLASYMPTVSFSALPSLPSTSSSSSTRRLSLCYELSFDARSS